MKTMTMTKRLTDDYDLAGWEAFYALHPHLLRSVGAAGDDDGGGGDGDSDAGDKSAGDTEDSTGDDKTADKAEGDEADKTADADSSEKGKGDDDDGDDADGAVYTADDFTMPEGVEVDEGMMNDFLAVANNKELTGKERDQALVSLYAEKQQEVAESQLQQWDDVRAGWLDDAKKDKEIGGKKFDENMGLAKTAMSKFGSPELEKFGEHYGWADHPEYLRLLVRVGAIVTEGKAPRGGAKDETTVADRWYKDSDEASGD